MKFINDKIGTKLTVVEGGLDGAVYFDLYEVAEGLGLRNTKASVGQFLKNNDDLNVIIDDDNPNSIFVDEGDMYLFALRSNSPKAREFQKWVAREVLPAIRKVGLLAVKELALLHAIRKVKNKEDALKIAPQECFDSILASSDTFYRLEGFVAPSEIADTLGITLKTFYSRLVSCDILDSSGELLKPGLAKHCSKYHNSYTECGKWYAWSLDVVGLLSTSPEVRKPQNRTSVSGGGQVELELTV